MKSPGFEHQVLEVISYPAEGLLRLTDILYSCSLDPLMYNRNFANKRLSSLHFPWHNLTDAQPVYVAWQRFLIVKALALPSLKDAVGHG